MSLGKPIISDAGTPRQVTTGDIIAGAEAYNTYSWAGSGTLFGYLLAGNILKRVAPTGAYTDTVDTSANILAAISPTGSVQAGTTWRFKYINTAAFAMTLATNTGVTIVANGNVNASSVKEYLITVTNGTPPQIFSGSITSGSPVVSGLTPSQLQLLSVGMLVSGAGISVNTTIVGIGTSSLTLSANATATNPLVSLTFNPTITIEGIGQGPL